MDGHVGKLLFVDPVKNQTIGWFTRSNVGGRFSTQLKQAGLS